MGSRRLRINLILNESPCHQRKIKNCRYKIKPHEAFRSKDQSKSSYCACIFASRLKAKKQMQTVPLNHQLLYN